MAAIAKSHAFVAVVLVLVQQASGQPQDVEAWPKVEQARVDVTLDVLQQSLTAKVRATCRVTNSGDVADTGRRWFPLGLPPSHVAPTADAPAFRVLVDGRPVEVTLKRVFELPQPNSGGFANYDPAAPTRADFEEWSRRIQEWVDADPQLLKLVAEVRELNGDREAFNSINRTFQKRLAEHLIHKDVAYAAMQVANGDARLSSLVKFLPEVDSTLRADGKFKRWEYVSFLEHGNYERFRPLEAGWLKQADEWLQSKPDLAELLPELRSHWQAFRARSALLKGPVTTYLHDQRGLNLPLAQELAGWIGRNGVIGFSHLSPGQFLTQMFPDLDARRRAATAQRDQRLRNVGFDRHVVSSTTGELYRSQVDPSQSFGWRDPTVDRILTGVGRVKEDDGWGRRPEIPFVPTLLTFDAPLEAGQSAEISVEYGVPLSPMTDGMQSTFRLGPSGLPELQCALPPDWKRTPVDVRITMPAPYIAVTSPGPESIAPTDAGATAYKSRLTSPDSNVHIVAVPGPDIWISRIAPAYMGSTASGDDILKLVAGVRNASVRPLMLALQYRELLRGVDRWEARKLARQFAEKYPTFPDITKQRELHPSARDSDKVCAWIERKSRSPEMDFGRAFFDQPEDHIRLINHNASGNYRVLSSGELTALAELVRQLDDTKLNLQERVGRRFLLCRAGIDRQTNLKAMLDLGELHADAVVPVLNCIAALTVEKPEAVTFVINQIDVRQHLNRELRGDDPARLQQMSANWALQSFRSPDAAPQLIAFTRSTDDGLLLQSAVRSLARMPVPELFDDLVAIADRIALLPGGPVHQYIELLGGCDRDRALQVLPAFKAKYPNSASTVSTILARLGDKRELPAAIAAYETGKRDQAEHAVGRLQELAEPADIARLKYRAGLPDWCNERLVSIIRRHGGTPDAFDFVERYYMEFVRGKPEFQYMTCVAAFEAIGDKRALPHLRNILANTERKSDAAQAIGTLMFGLRRPPDEIAMRADEVNSSIHVLMSRDATEARTTEAWDKVMADPETSMQAVVNGHIRWLLRDPGPVPMPAATVRRYAFLPRFGSLAAERLLEASRDCSLAARYQLAQLLSLLPADTLPLIRHSAFDPEVDSSERHTALLALGILQDDAATRDIAEVLENATFRMSAIDALQRIASRDSEAVLDRYAATLAAKSEPEFSERAALERLARRQGTNQ